MAQRNVCLCNGKYIGIETIFTVIKGMQINIPEKVEELRIKSRNNELFCPCGCGSNLILVAGDRNLREQHFRLKDEEFESECHFVAEGKISIDSKIVLKCWLEEKLLTNDIEARVPINNIGDVDRKYEFSFFSQAKKIAVSYCQERANLSDEKLEILKVNSNGIKIIYIVDKNNSSSNGQYPEALMKVQVRQGYCLLLDVENASYCDAKMFAVLYLQDNDGIWKELRFASGHLCDYVIDDMGQIYYKNQLLSTLLLKQKEIFEEEMETVRTLYEKEKVNRFERNKKIEEKEKEQREKLEVDQQAEMKRRDDDFKRNMKEGFIQQQTKIIDKEGNRWIKCQYCGLIDKESKFVSYGGDKRVNLGTCKTCSCKKESDKVPIVEIHEMELKPIQQVNNDSSICPDCGGKLRERNGQYGMFMGCSNYPKCKYTRKIRK